MEKVYQDMIEHVRRTSGYLERLKELASELKGTKVKSSYNAFAVCEKALLEQIALRREASELGTTLPNVMKSYRMTRKQETLVPSEIRFAPPHWIEDTSTETLKVWKDSCLVDKVYKVSGVSAATAQRLRASLQPQLEELFRLLEEKDWSNSQKIKYREEVVESYQKSSYKGFSEALANALWSLTSGQPEESDEQEEPILLDADSREFIKCMVSATIYSETVREELAKWARESGILLNQEVLEGWSEEYPDRLFPYLLKKRFGMEEPVNEWILSSLEEVGYSDGTLFNWSEDVDISLISGMVRICRQLLTKGTGTLDNDTIVSSLTDLCLQRQLKP